MCFSTFSGNWVWVDVHGIYLVSVCGCMWGEKQLDDLLWFSYSLPWGLKGLAPNPCCGVPWETVPLTKVSLCVHFPVSYQRLIFTICLRLGSFRPGGCNHHACKSRNTGTGFMFQNSQGMTDLSVAMGSRLDHAEATVQWLWINVCDNIPVLQSCS